QVAGESGSRQQQKAYEKLRDEIFEALQREYFTPSGRLAESTQTAYVCALFMGFAKPEQRQKVADLLKAKLDQAEGELRTGFVGTSYLLRVLSENGLNDDAYRLLLREDYPGWLYEVNMGATTVWERWNSVLPNGLVSDTGMNSLNHYAYGAVVEWMYRDMVGLQPCEDAPGFKAARLHPRPNARMRKVSARYASAAGTYEVAWEILPDGQFDLKVTVPFDAKVDCVLPGGAPDGDRRLTLEAGSHAFRYMPSTPLIATGAQ
ncbi:MAG TPA: alpha-L-rhamnosidase C-terminal domain-containing protein, partial [Clostridia bacterium]|nr:alpha-L-rhamnosidase C-terminal domain-containing protein [Clostridia bacterium]